MSRITLAQIEAFFWTVELGSAQRAANHLHLAQPSISLRLKDLRDAVGSDLLQRSSKGMVLTAEGRAFLPRATAIMAQIRAIHEPAAGEGIAGTIRVGLAEGFAVNCLAPLLAGLLQDHPALVPEWVVSTSTTLESALVDDGLDVAVLLSPIGHERLALKPLGSQPTSWVAPSIWKIDGAVAPKDIWDRAIICNPSPSAMYRQMTYWFANAGMQPANVSSCTSVAVIAELVASGLGCAVLPVRMAARHVGEGTMQLLASNPRIENGRLFTASRRGVVDPKISAFETVTAKVLERMDYLVLGM
ncbi:LysR family transcriptional regulator [Agrobacterium rosae]|uniref:HTH lysR-type domain-containing protein n=1 Tax=Agrobacterium rosae TaxID=1972867 RepID=A0AAE5RTD1_9HYPH|nr:LysR family transcriptional regulator [Agrobacterium rosae]KAA3509252.1 LysR family transcriptional regulator [Agrobacterium rosae]KAA3513948.1 LysR family transcriptional regulator [Agrobacterium rosae]MQB50973.1 LysR family transcriptional regulator [Agrobacterium rosae]POO48821.1 hypothetical protein CPJ18_22815 [Agrobacterium rosae]